MYKGGTTYWTSQVTVGAVYVVVAAVYKGGTTYWTSQYVTSHKPLKHTRFQTRQIKKEENGSKAIR